MSTDSFIARPSLGLDYAATVIAASPADLGSVSTLGPVTEGGYNNGQRAWCSSTMQLFVLRPAMGDADGRFIVATPDDPTRQWVLFTLVSGGTGRIVSITQQEIDLTQPQTINFFPRMSGLHGTIPFGPRVMVTKLDGTVTTGPTLQAGANAAINDVIASTTQVGLTTTTLNGTVVFNGAPAPTNILDLSLFGVRVQVTLGAVLGTATVLKGHLYFEMSVY